MDMRPSKPVAASRAEQVHIIMPMDVNASFNLFGGQLMKWIDVVAAVVARRHAGSEVLTAAVDHLEFIGSARLNDIVTLIGRITYVGRTSMEICVDSYVEHIGGESERLHVNRAYLTMVAIGADHKPRVVPSLDLQSDEERVDFDAGKQRREARKNAH